MPQQPPIITLAEAFAQQAYTAVGNRDREIMRDPYLLGFEIVEKNEDNSRLIGVFAFRVNREILMVTVFYLNGKVKGTDLLYRKGVNLFTYNGEKWISYLLSQDEDEDGRAVARSGGGNRARMNLGLGDMYSNPVSGSYKRASELQKIWKEAASFDAQIEKAGIPLDKRAGWFGMSAQEATDAILAQQAADKAKGMKVLYEEVPGIKGLDESKAKALLGDTIRNFTARNPGFLNTSKMKDLEGIDVTPNLMERIANSDAVRNPWIMGGLAAGVPALAYGAYAYGRHKKDEDEKQAADLPDDPTECATDPAEGMGEDSDDCCKECGEGKACTCDPKEKVAAIIRGFWADMTAAAPNAEAEPLFRQMLVDGGLGKQAAELVERLPELGDIIVLAKALEQPLKQAGVNNPMGEAVATPEPMPYTPGDQESFNTAVRVNSLPSDQDWKDQMELQARLDNPNDRPDPEGAPGAVDNRAAMAAKFNAQQALKNLPTDERMHAEGKVNAPTQVPFVGPPAPDKQASIKAVVASEAYKSASMQEKWAMLRPFGPLGPTDLGAYGNGPIGATDKQANALTWHAEPQAGWSEDMVSEFYRKGYLLEDKRAAANKATAFETEGIEQRMATARGAGVMRVLDRGGKSHKVLFGPRTHFYDLDETPSTRGGGRTNEHYQMLFLDGPHKDTVYKCHDQGPGYDPLVEEQNGEAEDFDIPKGEQPKAGKRYQLWLDGKGFVGMSVFAVNSTGFPSGVPGWGRVAPLEWR